MTFDLSNPIMKGIEDGAITATVSQQQYLQGYLSVELMALHIRRGFSLAQDILTGPVVIDKTNIGKFTRDVQEGFQ